MAKVRSKWTQELVDAELAKVYAVLQTDGGATADERLDFIRKRVDALEALKTGQNNLMIFAHMLTALRLEARHGRLGSKEHEHLIVACEAILTLEGVQPRESLLSHYHGELQLMRARIASNGGDAMTGLWLAMTGDRVAKRSTNDDADLERLLFTADQHLRRGHAKLAVEGYLAIATLPDASDLKHLAVCGLVRALRLNGDPEGALEVIAEHAKNAALPEEFKERLAWERSWCASGTGAEALAIQPIIVQASVARKVGFMIDASFAARAARTKEFLDRAIKARTIKRAFPQATRSGSPEGQALQCLAALEDLADASLPLEIRMNKIGELLADRVPLADVEREMLFLAATARTLSRLMQTGPATTVLAEYQSLSFSLSDGRRRDVLDLVQDLIMKQREAPEDEEGEALAEIPVSRVRRTMRMLSTGASLVGTVMTAKMRRVLASKAERERLQELELTKLGMTLRDSLGTMKGAMMKLGQILSSSQAILPPHLRAALVTLQDHAPSVEPAVMRPVVTAALGGPPEEVFAKWDWHHIASASIGQVYRATTHDGREVAVKVQFPNIATTLKGDIARLRLLKPILKVPVPGIDFEMLLRELEKQFLAECDYVSEARSQMEMKALLAHLPFINVPAVIPELSTDKVLTMEFASGLSYQEFLSAASPEQKNLAAHRIFDMAMTCMTQPTPYLNVDPNPGNFLFDGDRIHLLDFGCVKKWSAPFLKTWREAIRAAESNDQARFQAAFVATGHVFDVDKTDFKQELERFRFILKPMFDGGIQTANHKFLRECLQIATTQNTNARYAGFNPDTLFFYRVVLGLLTIMADLNFTADWKQKAKPLLHPEVDPWADVERLAS